MLFRVVEILKTAGGEVRLPSQESGILLSGLKNQRKRGAVFLAYFLFGVVMFSIFLYLTFPFSLLQSKLISSLERETGCRIVVGQKGFHFPLRLVWKGVQAACPHAALPQWDFESVDVRIAPVPLLWNRRGEVDFIVRMGGGEMKGHLSALQAGSAPSFSLKGDGKKVSLAQLGISGLLDLDLDGQWVNQDLLKGKGSLSFNLDGARFKQIGAWTVPIGEVSFSNIRGKINLRNGSVVIERFAAQGNEVDLTSEGGNLILREPLDGSLVTLSLKALPKGSLQQMATMFVQNYSGREPLTIGVKGPVRQPQISLNGRPIN